MTSCSTRTARSAAAWSRPRPRSRSRIERAGAACEGLTVTNRLHEPAVRRRGAVLGLDGASSGGTMREPRRARGYQRPGTGTNPTEYPDRSDSAAEPARRRATGGRARSARSARSRRTAGPSRAGTGSRRPGSRPGAAARSPRRPRPAPRSRTRRAARTAGTRWPIDRAEQRRVADRDRPDPARLRRVAVADGSAAAVAEQERRSGPRRARKPWSDGARSPRASRSIAVSSASSADGRGRRGVVDLVERHRARRRRGSVRKAPSRSARPTSRRSGIRGTIPSDAYSPFEIGWALSVAVAAATPAPRSAGHDRREQRPAEPRRLDLRQHEQHREEPQALAPTRRR